MQTEPKLTVQQLLEIESCKDYIKTLLQTLDSIYVNQPKRFQPLAKDPTLFDTDPLQPGEICLHSWMLYTSQAPVLDLTGEHIKTKEDIEATFHVLHLCPQEEEEQKSDGRKERRTSKSK